MYRQPIIIFGMVIPSVLLLLILVVIWVMLGKFEAKRDSKAAALKDHQLSLVTEKGLKQKLSQREGQMAYWDDYLEGDAMQSFNENLDTILDHFDANQVRMLEGKRPSGEGEFGVMSKTPYTRFELSFEGGFGPMQELLTELEILMPQLVMEGMSVTLGRSTAGQQASLRFKVTYLAWQK